MYCHLNVKTGSRMTGQSAAAKYDYISRDGRYARACQDEVVHIESGSMPAFASSDARVYWAAADSHERSNGRLFRSLTAALPNSLDLARRLELARSFTAHVTAGQLPYTLAVHAGVSKEEGAANNPHLHLVFSERVNDGVERAAEQWFRRAAPAGRDPASGGARKSERTKPREWLEETRETWAAEMNLAFGRAGVADRVTAESHAAQLARAREAGDAAEEERLLLNPPSEHIGPAAKHRWEERSPEQKPDRYVEYEQASAAAREARLAHARDAAEAAEARRRIDALDVKIAALEAEQRRAEAAARRRKEDAARREAEKRRDEAKWKENAKDRETALGLLPGGVELYLAHLADIDPKWNVNDNHATTRENVDAALEAAESDAPRLERLRGVLTDEAAAARYRQHLGKGAGRAGTADLDEALAPAEALRRRVSRLRELFAAPGGDAALFTALEDRSPSWPRTATPIDIERALGVAVAEPGPPAGGQLGTPGGPRGGTAVPGCLKRGVATNGRALRRVHRYRPPWQAPHADALGSRPRACHRRRAARAAGVTRFGEAALRVGAGARPEDAPQASPVESRASSGSFSGQRCPAGTGRRGRAGAARTAPGPQADRGRPRRRPEVGRHPPSYGHRRLCRRVDQRPAGDGRGSPSGPRTDQGGSATLVSHNRGCRTETPLPWRKGRGGRPAPSAGPRGVGGPIMDAPPDRRTTETRASRSAEPA